MLATDWRGVNAEDACITSRRTVKSVACRDTDPALSVLRTEMRLRVEPDIVQGGDGSREYVSCQSPGRGRPGGDRDRYIEELAPAMNMRMPY